MHLPLEYRSDERIMAGASVKCAHQRLDHRFVDPGARDDILNDLIAIVGHAGLCVHVHIHSRRKAKRTLQTALPIKDEDNMHVFVLTINTARWRAGEDNPCV